VRGTNSRVDPDLLKWAQTLEDGTLCAHRNGLTANTRRFVATTGFGPDHNLGVFNSNVDNIERAFVERYFLCKENGVFRPAFEVSSRAYKTDSLNAFRDSVLSHVRHLPVLTRQQVVDSYHGPKRRTYLAALESLARDALSERDAALSAFIKYEKQDVQKAPRIICPRSPRYNLHLARYLKRAEHHVFKAINKVFGAHTPATVIKGFNADDSARILRDKWERFRNPVCVGLDAVKLDMHIGVPALRYEHSFHKGLFPGDRLLRQLLNWQLVNKGVAHAKDGRITFRMKGKRSSGDINTSLGNCIIMCALVHSYAAEIGVDLELANNGDDCDIFMEQDDLPRFSASLYAWFKRKGFAMTVEKPCYEFEEIEFCQTKPVQLASGWRMVRKLESVLTKDPMCLIDVPSARVHQKWLHAVGTAGTALNTGVPVHQAFYSAFVRHGVPCSKGMRDYVFKNTSHDTLASGVGSSTIDARSRVSYYYAFGILPDEQVSMERRYDDTVVTDFIAQEPIPRDDFGLPGTNIE